MGYKQPSSGLPFKQIGSSPAKQNKLKKVAKKVIDPLGLTDNFDVGGYLRGEQGFIPDYKGESTKKTVNKVARKVVKATTDKPKAKNSVSKGASEAASEAVTRGLVEGGKMGLMKKKGKLMKESMKKIAKPVEKKYTKVRSDLKMKPPYKRPVGPRAN